MSVSHVLDERGLPQEHCFQIGEQGATNMKAPAPQPPPAQVQQALPLQMTAEKVVAPVAAAATQPSSEPAVLSTRQLMAQLRARLRVVEREIKARKTLEQERDQIRRLIGAAQQERNNLRRIRVAG